ncbi:MAG: winged helix-turn-helix transcriptional regulator [Nitrososphaeraceae archaeon]
MDEHHLSNPSVLISPVLTDTSLHKHQQNLMNIIERNPGVRYRELLRLTNSSNGVLSYHLAELADSKIIRVDRKRGVTRYYPIHISTEVSKIISHIKNPVSRHILQLLVERGSCTLSEIATLTNKAPSTISWYLQRLLKAEIVKRKPICLEGIFYKSRFYSVVDKTLVIDVLSKYIERSLDKVVNNYSEIIDDL